MKNKKSVLKRILFIILIVSIIFLLVSDKYVDTHESAKIIEEDKSNVPYMVSTYTDRMTVGNDGKITSNTSAKDLWNEMSHNNSNVGAYLKSPAELSRLMQAQMVTQYMDTRPSKEDAKEGESTIDDPIDWDAIFKDTDSTDVQGIVKMKRSDPDGNQYRMTFVDKETFYDWIEQYNEDGNEEAKQNLLKHFTLNQKADNNVAMVGEGSGAGALVNDVTTEVSQRILDASLKVPSPGSGLCQSWVRRVYAAAGLGQGYYYDAFEAYRNCKVSEDYTNIPVGAAVYGTGSGRGHGHVGIYIGDGMVRENINRSD